MKIAQIAPIIERVPAKKYGGTERVVYELTEELVARGHDVTLFASGDSITSAKLVSVYPTALREAKICSTANGANMWSLYNIGLAYHLQEQFDIIHDHTHVLGLPTAHLATTPVVTTLHDPVFPSYQPMFETFTNPYVVTISKSQSHSLRNANNIGTVYNGLTMDQYPYSDTQQGYLLFVGTFREEKGAHIAIQAARKLHMPLILAGKLDDWQMPYFNEYVKPYLSDTIIYIGEVDEKQRNNLMSKALCFLHPISWLEPFGLTLIESMACGTPVVALNKGSIPEIIQDGKTGYVCNDFSELVEKIAKVGLIDRRYCRQYALSQFNRFRMTDGYLAIYRKILRSTYHKLPDTTFSVSHFRKQIDKSDFVDL